MHSVILNQSHAQYKRPQSITCEGTRALDGSCRRLQCMADMVGFAFAALIFWCHHKQECVLGGFSSIAE
jgi:DUF1365 family protein